MKLEIIAHWIRPLGIWHVDKLFNTDLQNNKQIEKHEEGQVYSFIGKFISVVHPRYAESFMKRPSSARVKFYGDFKDVKRSWVTLGVIWSTFLFDRVI